MFRAAKGSRRTSKILVEIVAPLRRTRRRALLAKPVKQNAWRGQDSHIACVNRA
jgi:hypothetical protein